MRYEPVLDTEKAKKSNLSKSIVFALFGIYLLCYACYCLYSHAPITTAVTALVMGLFLVFAANFSKRYFIAKQGIVQTIHSWKGRNDSLMPWSELYLVSIVTDGDKLTVYFDSGEKVWKLEFDSWQRKEIKQLIKKYVGDKDINEIRK